MPMTLEENLADMQMHADEFVARTGYTYSILDGDQVIGCVYGYPPGDVAGVDAKVRSWVRASHAALDTTVRDQLNTWLLTAWPFTTIRY